MVSWSRRRTGAPGAGEKLGRRYRLRKIVGKGATAVVWEADDLSAKERVAVKVLNPDVARDPGARKRFRREVKMAGLLRHANVVRVRDWGDTAPDLLYIVMDLVTGVSLADEIRRGPLPASRALWIAIQVLDALAEAHRVGLVHRDLKPRNVMLVQGPQGERDVVKICDFGLAKPFESAPASPGMSATTLQGQLCGTPEYMSPEQARCEPLDGRSDLYSVAVVIYEMLTGRVPFSGTSTIAILSRHISEQPAAPSSVAPAGSVTPELDALLCKALAKDRDQRPVSAQVFRDELRTMLWQELSAGSGDAVPQIGSDCETLAPGLPSSVPQGRVSPLSRYRLLAIVLLAAAVPAVLLEIRSLGFRRPARPAARDSGLLAFPLPARPGSLPVQETSPEQASTNPDPSPGPASARPARVPSVKVQRRSRIASEPAPTPTPPPVPASAEQGAAPAVTLSELEGLLAAGEIRQACDRAEQASSAAPSSAPLQKFLGKCNMRLGQVQQGRAHYRRYLDLAPTAPDAEFVRSILNREGIP